MKKTRQQSVLTLFTAAVFLFGSSGGVAWGQIYQSQRNPDRAQLRYYGNKDGGLTGTTGSISTTTGPSKTSNDSGFSLWVQGGFSVDNNFGPGETGVIKPSGADADNNTNSGTWAPIPSGAGTATSAFTFFQDNGRITVGGTSNHIGHMVTGGDRQYNYFGAYSSFNNGIYRDGDKISTSVSYSNNRYPKIGSYDITNDPNYKDDAHNQWIATTTHGSTEFYVKAPNVPNTSEGWFQATVHTPPTKTEIQVDARAKTSSKPWNLEIFNFEKNPWYYYKTDLGTLNWEVISPRIDYEHWSSGPGWSQTHTGPNTRSYTRVTYGTTSVPGTGEIPAHITLLAGSHVRLTGYLGKSIGHGTLNTTTAHLNLPSDYYTLMNDEDVEFGSINYNSVLGTNAIFGVKTQIGKPISTNPAGGTILIGQNTNATSQGHITITAPTTNEKGNAYGFAWNYVHSDSPNPPNSISEDYDTAVVYTKTPRPRHGTANLGNYDMNHPITVLKELHLPTSVGNGGIQIFNLGNSNSDLIFQNKVPNTTGTGNVLLLARRELRIQPPTSAPFTTTLSGAGNISLIGSEVFIEGNENHTGTGNVSNKGVYGIYSFADRDTFIGNISFKRNSGDKNCTPASSWCNSTEWDKYKITVDPDNVPKYEGQWDGHRGRDYRIHNSNLNRWNGDGEYITQKKSSTLPINVPSPHPFLLPLETANPSDPTYGNINFTATTSTVTVSNNSSAYWQANGSINAGIGKTLTWKNNGSGTAAWMAGGSINVGNGSNANWESNSSGHLFWQAGGDILTDRITANWKALSNSTVRNVAWIAKGNIKNSGNSTMNWTTAKTANMLWEAGKKIITDNITANWSSTDEGSLKWLAKGDIQAVTPTSIAWSTSTTSKGSMIWESGDNIIAKNGTNTFTFEQKGTTSADKTTGHTRWQAIKNIVATGIKTFTNESQGGGTMIWNTRLGDIVTGDAGNVIKFIINHDNAGKLAWQAGHDIRTKGNINFTNEKQANKSNMEWVACQNIRTNYDATGDDTGNLNAVLFTNKSMGDMIWHAENDSIVTRSYTQFINEQNSTGNITWHAGNDIHTYFGTTSPRIKGTGVDFKLRGNGRSLWHAGRDITTHNAVWFNCENTAADTSDIVLLAGRNITLGGVMVGSTPEYPTSDASLDNEFRIETAKNDTILLKTHTGYIRTNALVNIERTNDKVALTKLWAGCEKYSTDNNIDIEHVFNYTETSPAPNNAGGMVHLYAENDILSNVNPDGCDDRTAPITFTSGSDFKTRTLWEAERNINTRSRVEFKYGESTVMGPLTWLSRAGYIQTERPVKITYKSDSTISFLAEEEFKGYNQARRQDVRENAKRTGRRGNIHFFDSVDIRRENTQGGLTQIKAKNHIWTAMLNFQDMGSIGDTMEIISHLGDIYLGYNDGQNPGTQFADDRYVADWQDQTLSLPPWNIRQQAPSVTCPKPAIPDVDYNKNRFTYTIPASNTKGHLWIKAGWEEKTDRNAVLDATENDARKLREAGGNIYFTHIDVNQHVDSDHPTEISIPFSGLWRCDNATTKDSALRHRSAGSMQRYENAGIISGVNPCLNPYPTSGNSASADTGLIYRGGKGRLTVDAGNRGNIIFNKGAYLNFQSPTAMTGDAIFRTREGDIDMRDPFNVDSMRGSLLFLAQVENLSDLQTVGICGCKEERNNVYLQDFQYRSIENGGSVFVGADNNIKLNYGGLQNVGTRHDPFLSTDYKPCPKGGQAKIGRGYLGHAKAEARLKTCDRYALHCDANEAVNKARTFLLKFDKSANNADIKSGGFAAVASDYIDVYKKFEYYGGKGSGMGSVPSTGTLHGESVSGYGLFMKTQANKNNWNINIFKQYPDCPTTCDGTNCDRDYLHMVARMTFHDDAYIEAHNQRVLLTSPVVESFGKMTLNTATDHGSNTQITLKADSLIFHDDFVKLGNSVKLSTWSGLHKDLPIMKFGHKRYTPPFTELMYDNCGDTIQCAPCHYYIRGSKDPLHMMDTITIKFGDGAYLERLNTVVFDHTVLTCLTDSFDHVMGGVQNAQIFTDTFKIRNQVDLFADKYHERDAHLELISEQQMHSKDYAGIYTKHLHMEPIGACERPYSELWTSDDRALDVITTSIFGGFGFIHADVHVENLAHLNAGFTSLRLKGMCYEHLCGTQRMEDLRLDGGAQLHFSVGTTKGLNGEYCDAIDVDLLTAYGPVDVNIEVRPCEKMERRCYPIIYYKSLTPNSLNGFRLNPSKIKIDGEEVPLTLNTSTDGVVYVCVGDALVPDVNHTVSVPSVAGVTTDPGPGFWKRPARSNFKFKAKYTTEKPLAVRANYMVRGVEELLEGKLNANGEYEYIIPHLMEDVRLTIGPDPVANEFLAGAAVWSYGEQIYFRVDRSEIASIYSVAGQLVRKIELPEGDSSIPMRRGAYVITLRDGSVHKVIVR